MSKPVVFLQPGDLVLSQRPVRVKTVVGSCIAIMMRAPRLGWSAMAHCLLPEARARYTELPREEALRHVDSAVELILAALGERGALVRELEIKFFGGSDHGCGYEVGKRNVESMERSLARHGLCAAARDTGGTSGRAIEFDTATGDVFVRQLSKSAAEAR